MATGGRTIVYYLSKRGHELARLISAKRPDAEARRYASGAVASDWPTARAMVFITASGIAVRAIAPHIKDKAADPAVIVMDEAGRHVISLLGGHEAGANALCDEVAGTIGAASVITTATDAHGLRSIDTFAKDHGLLIEDRTRLPEISALHIRQGRLNVYSDIDLPFPDDLARVTDIASADVAITRSTAVTGPLLIRPRDVVLGIGMNSGTDSDEIRDSIAALMRDRQLSPSCISLIATHDKKKHEPGLKEYARRTGLRCVGYTTDELNAVTGVAESGAAMRALGVRAVSEPAALLAAHADTLLSPKVKSGNVTLALAVSSVRPMWVVGTGPGDMSHMTPEAHEAIRGAEVIVGFKPYLEMIEPLMHGKEVVSSAMTEEVDRVKRAVELALEGRRVALISGGDAGVYAMAGLAFEVVKSANAPVDVIVVPGISALNACAARLGAPLMHDFAVVSLSDRLTPWEVIAARIEAAASADYVIVIYNPRSRGRKDQIVRARDIVLRHRAPQTPVGIVRAAMRPEEDVTVTDLGSMLTHEIDMRSTVIIGNSKTFRDRDRMVTPRGYERKYEL